MKDKVCIVTGGSRGIGKATALGLASHGAQVVVVCRDVTNGETAVAEIKRKSSNDAVALLLVDLSSQQQIKQFAADFTAKYDRLDLLINNAGIVARERQLTEDGIEKTFAVNHLAPFLLTNLLRPLLKETPGARIITVASQVHSQKIDFDNLQGEKRFHKLEPYKQSKLANILFTFELARRLQGSDVTANCLHPGVIRTGLLDEYDYVRRSESAAGRVKGLLKRVIGSGGSSPAEGARLSLYLATSPEVADVSGKYFSNGREARAADIAYDETVAAKLWQVSETLTGLA